MAVNETAMAVNKTTMLIIQEVLNAIPLYNPVTFGMPLYFIIIIIEFAIIMLGLIVFWQYIYEPMKPVWGFRAASLSNKPQSIVHGMNGQIWLEATEYIAGLFRSLGLPLMWIITAPVSGQMGRVATTELSDDWNIVHNIDIDYAIVEIVSRYNAYAQEQNPEMAADELIGKNLVIYDFKSFNEKLMDGTLDSFCPAGVKLPPFRVVDLDEVRRYLPKWNASHFAGYINQEVAKRIKEDTNKHSDMMKTAMICGAIILVCSIMAYLIISSAH